MERKMDNPVSVAGQGSGADFYDEVNLHASVESVELGRLRRENKQLIQERNYFASVIKYFRNGLLTTDNDLRVRHFNLTVERLLGYDPSELKGMKLSRLIQDQEEAIANILAQGGACVDPRTGEMGEFSFVARDGRTFPVEACFSVITLPDGTVSGLTCTFRDVSQKKHMEQAMARMDRLASLGELASGMAHEIKNPLACIAGVLQNFIDVNLNDPCAQMIPELLQQVEKIDAIINGLLNFAQPCPTEKRQLRLKNLLFETMSLLDRLFKERNIRLIFDAGEFDPVISGDRQLLQQAMLNIFKNACDVLEEVPGERIIKIALTHLCNRDPGSLKPGEQPYEMVEITFADNGPGIGKNLLEMIFNPFFTTKNSGIGLGLATSHRIIEEHDGALVVDSSPGQGTIFKVTLPLA